MIIDLNGVRAQNGERIGSDVDECAGKTKSVRRATHIPSEFLLLIFKNRREEAKQMDSYRLRRLHTDRTRISRLAKSSDRTAEMRLVRSATSFGQFERAGGCVFRFQNVKKSL